MVILEIDFKSLDDKIVNSAVSLLKPKQKNVKCILRSSGSIFEKVLFERETSLYKYTRSNRRWSSEREGKTFYA